MARYKAPDFFTKRIANPLLMLLMRFGITFKGGHTLAVRGRTTGKIQAVPVNPLDFEDMRYLVAPRGNTQWARNLRAAGEGELRLGRQRERFTASELTDDLKPPILRAYLKNWASETQKFFGVSDNPSDDELRAIAPHHPVFRIGVGDQSG